MIMRFLDPKGNLPKGYIKYIERKINSLQYELEIITPKSEQIYESIDHEKITNLKEEIAMLKNELLILNS